MATVNFTIPDNVEEAFNETFADANKSAIVADLMREAVEREHRRQASRAASARIRARRSTAPVRTPSELIGVRHNRRP